MRNVLQNGQFTAEQLLHLPDDEQRHELLAGRLVSEPPASWPHGAVAARVSRILSAFVSQRRLGVVASNDTGFVLARSPDTVRGPDVAYVSQARVDRAG